MSSRFLRPKRARRPKPGELNARQEKFCMHLLADLAMDGKAAAKKAGYGNPASAACRLLRNPAVRRRLGREVELIQSSLRKTAAEVLQYLETAVFFNPLDHFSPGGKGGGWLIRESDLKRIPPEIGRLITDCELQSVETSDGTKMTLCRVRFVDKTKMAEYLAKHHGLFEKDHEQSREKLVVDLSQLYQRRVYEDPVEQLIANPEPPAPSLNLPTPSYTVSELVDDSSEDS